MSETTSAQPYFLCESAAKDLLEEIDTVSDFDSSTGHRLYRGPQASESLYLSISFHPTARHLKLIHERMFKFAIDFKMCKHS